jgi:TonB family protein
MMSALMMWLAQGAGVAAPAPMAHPATAPELAVIAQGLQGDLPGVTASRLSDFRVSYASADSGEACGFVDGGHASEGSRQRFVHVQLFADESKAWHAYVFSVDDASSRASCEARGLAPGHAPPATGHVLRHEPAYPAAAASRGEEGTVVLRLTVAPDGRVSGAEVKSSSGHAQLDTAARDAARTWSFDRDELPRWFPSHPWLLVPITFERDGLKVSSPL